MILQIVGIILQIGGMILSIAEIILQIAEMVLQIVGIVLQIAEIISAIFSGIICKISPAKTAPPNIHRRSKSRRGMTELNPEFL
jgi:hypothetical protein